VIVEGVDRIAVATDILSIDLRLDLRVNFDLGIITVRRGRRQASRASMPHQTCVGAERYKRVIGIADRIERLAKTPRGI
jgi:hypothetical protein